MSYTFLYVVLVNYFPFIPFPFLFFWNTTLYLRLFKFDVVKQYHCCFVVIVHLVLVLCSCPSAKYASILITINLHEWRWIHSNIYCHEACTSPVTWCVFMTLWMQQMHHCKWSVLIGFLPFAQIRFGQNQNTNVSVQLPLLFWFHWQIYRRVFLITLSFQKFYYMNGLSGLPKNTQKPPENITIFQSLCSDQFLPPVSVCSYSTVCLCIPLLLL